LRRKKPFTDIEEKEQMVKFEDLPSDWNCPVCKAGKDVFVQVG
jgi:rubredoxin